MLLFAFTGFVLIGTLLLARWIVTSKFGRVLTEAMASQVPVIGSTSGAIPEVIGDAGLIFPEGDAAALAGCLRQLQSSAALRQTVAARGAERAQRLYSQAVIAQATATVYGRLLGQEPAAAQPA